MPKQEHGVGTRKLRIALFGGRGLPHTYGGAEAFFLELAPRLVQRGHEVIVYNRRSLFREKPKSYKGVRLIYLPSIETKSLGTPTHTLACVFDVLFRNVDVMMSVNVANAFHLVVPRLFGKNVACNVDGLDWKRDKWGAFAKKYFYWNARSVGKICPKGIITDAQEMRRIYLEEFGTPSACITYGANIERSENPEVVRQYGLEPNQYYLIASRMVPENNADLIIEAFNRLRTSRVLAVAGNANYRSAFVEKLMALAGRKVVFLGHVPSVDHVKELHCNAYCYVHGHMLGGTNPALVKALGYGNMILALDTAFNREVIRDYGLYFSKNAQDLMARLQYVEENPGMVEEYRRRAPQRIREAYTWDHIVDQYEELFTQLANGEDPTRVHSSVREAPEYAMAGLASAGSAADD
jgi:glycosyltransferase involved in cell wall biosynthesis